jgi:hypothetical protein
MPQRPATDTYNFENAFRVVMQSRAEALFVLEAPSIFRGRAQIAALALKTRLPTSFAFRDYVEIAASTARLRSSTFLSAAWPAKVDWAD